jgi:D-beta-D-heptose 7-phosphate kinase/D-beta-D-heptose 1-phosphate adenosyltransferase
MRKIVLVTGGFDPVHSGHIKYLEAAKSLGDILIVGVNSDAWLARKKDRSFMPITERTQIMQALKFVDEVFPFGDHYDADGSAKKFIREILHQYPNDNIIFANGGDRTAANIPEMEVLNSRLSFVFGVGGENKANSSSWILEEWESPKVYRQWGYYRVISELGPNFKVKELEVNPHSKLSMQRHQFRNEYWIILEGIASIYTIAIDPGSGEEIIIDRGSYIWPKFTSATISKNDWHQLSNETNEPLRILEIQYGEKCVEEDIERKPLL